MTYSDAIFDTLEGFIGFPINKITIRLIEGKIETHVWSRMPEEYRLTFKPYIYHVAGSELNFSVRRSKNGISLKELEDFLNKTKFPINKGERLERIPNA